MIRALLVCMLLCGCGSCEERPSGEDPVEREGPDIAPQLGKIRGVIRIAEGMQPPEYPPEALHGAGPAGERPEECPESDGREGRPVVVSDGGLEGIMVSATGDQETFFAALGEWEPQQRELTIRDCRLQPALVVATRGDSLVISNENTYPFLLAVGRTSFMEAVLQGQPKQIELDEGGSKAIRCGFAAPCGRTDVITVYHPVHTVSGEGGRFELTNVPRDQEVEIHAWHPLFKDSSVAVTIEGDEIPEIELTIEPIQLEIPEPREPVPGEPF